MFTRCALLLCLVLLLPGVCLGSEEVKPFFFPLQGPLLQPEAEISGLAWHRGRLLLMPQYPDFDSDSRKHAAALFAVQRQDLLSRIVGRERSPLPMREIEVQGLEVCSTLPGYEGFEAIAVQGDTAWLLVEARHKGRMRAWLAQGAFNTQADGSEALRLEVGSVTELEMPFNLRNLGYETLVAGNGRLLAIMEGNGRNLTEAPYALEFSTDKPLPHTPRKLPLPSVEYRITDATALQMRPGQTFFWAMNYFWPGDKKLYAPAEDGIAAQWGQGATHARSDAVERILRLELLEDRVQLADEPPLQLALGLLPRNWEGLAYLEQGLVQGLLLATDKYPGTLLGFVPLQ